MLSFLLITLRRANGSTRHGDEAQLPLKQWRNGAQITPLGASR
jgi:hypothetical protein